MHAPVELLALARPSASDLWAFGLLAGLWVVILACIWGMVLWLRDPHDDDGPRGL